MKATISKWGNSLGLRIPGALAKSVDLRSGSTVDVAIVKDTIVVTPLKQSKPSLARLLKAVNESNRHGEEDWGAVSGKEVW
jgi:antitoxin MazE